MASVRATHKRKINDEVQDEKERQALDGLLGLSTEKKQMMKWVDDDDAPKEVVAVDLTEFDRFVPGAAAQKPVGWAATPHEMRMELIRVRNLHNLPSEMTGLVSEYAEPWQVRLQHPFTVPCTLNAHLAAFTIREPLAVRMLMGEQWLPGAESRWMMGCDFVHSTPSAIRGTWVERENMYAHAPVLINLARSAILIKNRSLFAAFLERPLSQCQRRWSVAFDIFNWAPSDNLRVRLSIRTENKATTLNFDVTDEIWSNTIMNLRNPGIYRFAYYGKHQYFIRPHVRNRHRFVLFFNSRQEGLELSLSHGGEAVLLPVKCNDLPLLFEFMMHAAGGMITFNENLSLLDFE